MKSNRIFSKLLGNADDNHYVIEDALRQIENGIDKLNPFLDDESKSFFEDVQFHISDLRKNLDD